MPELPECEIVVRGLQPLVGYEIAKVYSVDKYAAAANPLLGRTITSVSRVGKLILFNLDKGVALSHLRMTGAWLMGDRYTTEKHRKITLDLVSPGMPSKTLSFVDTRGFGTFDLCPSAEKHSLYTRLGPDGLLLDRKYIVDRIVLRAIQSKLSIKSFLLDQSVVAGAGNICVLETLWRAGVDPRHTTKELAVSQIRNTCRVLHEVFVLAIELGGTSISDYVNVDGKRGEYQKVLRVYGRKDKPCYSCFSPIKKIMQSGRSTFYCSECQK